MIPVIAPLGAGRNGETFNVNGDTAAGAIAGALKADRLLLLTDVAGVKERRPGEVVTELTAGAEVRGPDRRGRDRRRHDPQDRNRACTPSRPACAPWSSSTAACRMPCCWSCSPNTAPGR
jgi:hypothetical protein